MRKKIQKSSRGNGMLKMPCKRGLFWEINERFLLEEFYLLDFLDFFIPSVEKFSTLSSKVRRERCAETGHEVVVLAR